MINFSLVLILFSAGVGRTGTFIAVDAMMQRLKEKDDLDIYNFVTQMRTKRTFMVQNMVCRHDWSRTWYERRLSWQTRWNKCL